MIDLDTCGHREVDLGPESLQSDLLHCLVAIVYNKF